MGEAGRQDAHQAQDDGVPGRLAGGVGQHRDRDLPLGQVDHHRGDPAHAAAVAADDRPGAVRDDPAEPVAQVLADRHRVVHRRGGGGSQQTGGRPGEECHVGGARPAGPGRGVVAEAGRVRLPAGGVALGDGRRAGVGGPVGEAAQAERCEDPLAQVVALAPAGRGLQQPAQFGVAEVGVLEAGARLADEGAVAGDVDRQRPGVVVEVVERREPAAVPQQLARGGRRPRVVAGNRGVEVQQALVGGQADGRGGDRLGDGGQPVDGLGVAAAGRRRPHDRRRGRARPRRVPRRRGRATRRSGRPAPARRTRPARPPRPTRPSRPPRRVRPGRSVPSLRSAPDRPLDRIRRSIEG